MSMKFTSFLLITLLLFSQTAGAGNKAVLIGGYGESSIEGNQFDPAFFAFHKSLKERGWAIDYYFPFKGDREASNKNVTNSITKSLREAKTGDQVLILFHTHGMAQEDGVLTHKVYIEDFFAYNLDDLNSPISTAKKRGVKVALLDFSCYSGQTQKLKSSGACVVTLSATNFPGKGYDPRNSFAFPKPNFTWKFLAQVPDKAVKITLQDHFLRARNADIYWPVFNIPQISAIVTPGLEAINSWLMNAKPNNHSRPLSDCSIECRVAYTEAFIQELNSIYGSLGLPNQKQLESTMAGLKPLVFELKKIFLALYENISLRGFYSKTLYEMAIVYRQNNPSHSEDFYKTDEYSEMFNKQSQAGAIGMELARQLDDIYLKLIKAERQLYQKKYEEAALRSDRELLNNPCTAFQL